MRLETHEVRIVDSVTAEDIELAVASLTEVGEAFIVLSDDGEAETYVQAAGTVGEEFIVERRDGRAGEHYRGDRRVSAVDLVAMLVGYLDGASDWSSSLTWHRVRVDQDPAFA
jgi:hypothetical protein